MPNNDAYVSTSPDTGLPSYLSNTDFQMATGVELGNAIQVVEVQTSVPSITALAYPAEQTATKATVLYDSAKKVLCKRYSLFKTRK